LMRVRIWTGITIINEQTTISSARVTLDTQNT
jgi:hypothetical protein